MTKYKNKKHWSLSCEYQYLIRNQKDNMVRRFFD